jgi:hypothetical protein
VRDWNAEVREILRDERIPPEIDGVMAELVNQVEDSYENLRPQGPSEAQATQRALGEFGNPRQLARAIRTARRPAAHIHAEWQCQARS